MFPLPFPPQQSNISQSPSMPSLNHSSLQAVTTCSSCKMLNISAMQRVSSVVCNRHVVFQQVNALQCHIYFGKPHTFLRLESHCMYEASRGVFPKVFSGPFDQKLRKTILYIQLKRSTSSPTYVTVL